MEAAFLGAVLTYLFRIDRDILMVIWMSTVIESRMISFERCSALCEIPQERQFYTDDEIKSRVPANWPSEGRIQLKNLYIKYRPNLDYALRGVSLNIHAKEKVGIVGRTGAGKSTIILAMLRLLETDKGSIVVDDVDISTLGLEQVR